LNNLFKNIAIWMVIGIVLMTVFNQFNTRQTAQNTIDYSQFMEEVRNERISKVSIQGRTLEALTTDGKKIISYAPSDLWMVSDLLKYNVKVSAKPEEEQSFLTSIFVSWFPMLLLIGVWIFFMRQMQGGGKGGAFSFGKSKARMMDQACTVHYLHRRNRCGRSSAWCRPWWRQRRTRTDPQPVAGRDGRFRRYDRRDRDCRDQPSGRS